MASPNCGKCGSTEITWTPHPIRGEFGDFVHCAACGAVITWVPKTNK